MFHAEKWPIGTIATQLGLHHTTVQRVLKQTGVEERVVAPRPSMVEPFLPFIAEQLEKYPRLRASRLYTMVKERGYPGGPDHFRRLVGRLRPKRAAEAFQRLKTLPGEQAQVDWAHFGKLQVGRAMRTLWAFVMVLSYSRRVFLRFMPGASMPFFLRGHVEAFAEFGGVPRVLLYDNLKSAVLARHGDAVQFNPRLLELATHYCFEPRPVAVARGNEKGRVERAIRYVRDSFFAAREFKDLADLNHQADDWTATTSMARKWVEDKERTVGEAFDDERSSLLKLPDEHFPALERVEAGVARVVTGRGRGRGPRPQHEHEGEQRRQERPAGRHSREGFEGTGSTSDSGGDIASGSPPDSASTCHTMKSPPSGSSARRAAASSVSWVPAPASRAPRGFRAASSKWTV